jgi:hypothetical protein
MSRGWGRHSQEIGCGLGQEQISQLDGLMVYCFRLGQRHALSLKVYHINQTRTELFESVSQLLYKSPSFREPSLSLFPGFHFH